MATPEVRAFVIYINNKKAYTIHQQTYTPLPNRNPLFGQDGYIAHSKGVVMCRITVTEVTPIGGSDLSALEKKCLNQENVQIGLLAAGNFHRCEMAITAFEMTSQTESGVATGTATFEGGVPKIT